MLRADWITSLHTAASQYKVYICEICSLHTNHIAILDFSRCHWCFMQTNTILLSSCIFAIVTLLLLAKRDVVLLLWFTMFHWCFTDGVIHWEFENAGKSLHVRQQQSSTAEVVNISCLTSFTKIEKERNKTTDSECGKVRGSGLGRVSLNGIWFLRIKG